MRRDLQLLLLLLLLLGLDDDDDDDNGAPLPWTLLRLTEGCR